jgi:hypothetical protein
MDAWWYVCLLVLMLESMFDKIITTCMNTVPGTGTAAVSIYLSIDPPMFRQTYNISLHENLFSIILRVQEFLS